MTKIHILSDLHLEGRKLKNYEVPECDVVVLAGDIGTGLMAFDWIENTFPPELPVVYVAGNHEFYKRNYDMHILEMQRKVCDLENVHFLDNDCVILNDVLFVGGTLWTDFNLYGTQAESMQVAKQWMNDFRLITQGDHDMIFTPERTVVEFSESVKGFENLLQIPVPKKVLVTHHLTSPKSISKQFEGSDLNPAFASDLEWLLLKHKVDMSICGHTHSSFDYMLEDTRMLCNPRGYRGNNPTGNENPEFNQSLVVEI